MQSSHRSPRRASFCASTHRPGCVALCPSPQSAWNVPFECMDSKQPPRLSCAQCRARKKRCDKGNPCSSCVDAGIHCDIVQRSRLPRGRSGLQRTKNSELEDRIIRIENLLKNAPTPSNHMPAASVHPSRPDLAVPVAIDEATGTESGFIAPQFWATLTREVAGIRQTLEDCDGEETEEHVDGAFADKDENRQHVAGAKTLLFGQDPQHGNDLNLPRTSPAVWGLLLDVYKERVDNVYKLLHWPTVLSSIVALNQAHQDVTLRSTTYALQFSIYFMAVCTLSDEETQRLLFRSRQDLISLYRTAAEVCLSEANLLGRPDFAVLQAFVIYIMGLRTSQTCATSWSLLAVAVRLAKALRLGSEDPKRFSVLEVEIRRRLWFGLGVLDMFATFDRGTAPLLLLSDFRSPPQDMDDDDFDGIGSRFTSDGPRSGMRDMTFFLHLISVMLCYKRVSETSSCAEDGWKGWSQKLEIISELTQQAEQTLSKLPENKTPLQKLLGLTTKEIIAAAALMLRRPLYKSQRSDIPPWDDFNVLEAAAETLEGQSKKLSADLAPWAWKAWSPWYALAVALAELCKPSWTPLCDRAYLISRETYDRDIHRVADGAAGMLWKPIARLMRQVEAIHTRHGSRWLNPTISYSPDSPDPQTNDQSNPTSIEHKQEETSSELPDNADELPVTRGFTDMSAVIFDEEDLFDWDRFLNDVAELSSQEFS
ncbi:hypothetical protein GGR57DRAFT_513333 [Xylariaceae sp. FL1272]|nr:hypothetical protein GGR57DRAFT_513333 [Xylariaceae sp. FL1272]